jgi:hypothetical protein
MTQPASLVAVAAALASPPAHGRQWDAVYFVK